MAAINHCPPDRVPRTFKGTPEVDRMMVEHFGLGDIEEIKPIFKADNLHWPWRGIGARYTGTRMQTFDNGEQIDEWGVRRRPMNYGGGEYLEIAESPLAGATTVAEIESYEWPTVDEYDFSGNAEQCSHHPDEALCTGVWCTFETVNYLRGFQNFLTDLALNEDIAAALIRKVEDFRMACSEAALASVPAGTFQIYGTGDDFGSQESLLMSLDMWKKYFYPGIKKAYARAHKHGLKVIMHSDGAVRPLIPYLIDAGLNVLDPIQIHARGMDPQELLREFGKDLAFHGTIDVQRIMPFGTPDEVKDEVKKHLDLFGPNGGLFLSPSHCIQPGTPVGNIIAMYEAADEYEGS